MAQTYHPDVVLLDIGLPGMTGYEVAEQLRRQPEFSGTLLVAITGYGQEEDRRRCCEAGFNHHLVKPVIRGAPRPVGGAGGRGVSGRFGVRGLGHPALPGRAFQDATGIVRHGSGRFEKR